MNTGIVLGMLEWIKEKWDPLNGTNGKGEIPEKHLYQKNPQKNGYNEKAN